MNPESTHVPALALAIHTYGKHVLEVGIGWYSTPLIYALCPREDVTSLETAVHWVNALKPFGGDRIILTDNIVQSAKDTLGKSRWQVVFLDCYEGADRVAIAKLFLNEPWCCIVAHDTERNYWQPLLNTVKYVKHFDLLNPRTSWLSNVLQFPTP